MTHVIRQFSVCARHVDGHFARVLAETSFEAAAVAYVEAFGPVADEGAEISVIVCDLATGHEQCFRIDSDSNAASPCD